MVNSNQVKIESQIESDTIMSCEIIKIFYSFNISQTQDLIKKMIIYVFSENSKISDKVVSTFTEIYIYKPGTQQIQTAEKIVFQFIILSYQMTIGENLALEAVLIQLIEDNKISQRVGDALWHIILETDGTFDFKMVLKRINLENPIIATTYNHIEEKA